MKIGQVLKCDVWGDVNPDTLKVGLGGRETALVQLATQWAKQGHEVVNFVDTSKGKTWYEEGGGKHSYVSIKTTKQMLSNFDWDVVVAWEIPSVFKEEEMRENVRLKVMEMQCAHVPDLEVGYPEQYIDYVAVLSEWAGEFLVHSGLDMADKMVVLPNGIDISRFPVKDAMKPAPKKGSPWRFVYSSSPDRGLDHLLKLWPKIRKLNSNSELYICYGLDKWFEAYRFSHNRHAEMVLDIETRLGQPGVFNVGKIGQQDLARLQLDATAWVYPLDALWPTETGCITAVENAAAGNPLIISDGDCLAEEFGHFSHVIPLPFDADEWIGGIESTLTIPEFYKDQQERGREFAETRTWERIGNEWLQFFANALC